MNFILLFSHLFLFIAAVGTLTSTAFLILALLGARHFHRQAAKHARGLDSTSLPPVSVLKPVHGLEPELEKNLESFFRQDYPRYEVLFAADEESDPALEVVRRLSARYPGVPSRILVTGEPTVPNPPAFCFQHMSEAAAHAILVTSDSDVRVEPNYLREVVAPLLEPRAGMVTCVYRGVSQGGLWSDLDAIGMSVEMTAGVLTANLLEGMKFGLGPTIVVRQDSVASIGGFGALGEYFSNDFVIGNLIAKAGYKVVLSHHVVEHRVPPMSLRAMWHRQVRWAKGTRYSRPKGHLGTVLTFAVPYGLLGLAAGWAAGNPWLGAGLLGTALLNRVTESLAIGWGVVRDPKALRAPWLYPLRDLLGFLVWCASYVGEANAMWRGKRYALVEGGKILLRERPPTA
ncbi:MAG: glycosyltransferase [Acidobacteria bacterium]|nr:glycosyltransferase [Acidobacteriota bacterium]